MPDAAGNFKGTGWSRKSADAWERVFGNAATQQPSDDEPTFNCWSWWAVPHERADED